MATLDVAAATTTDRGISAGAQGLLTLNRAGALVIVDWYTQAILDGHGYQVRAGTITTPLVGDVAITDTAAEYCVDATAGHVIIPVHNNVSVRAGTGTAHEFAAKSVATVSSAGTAFVLLPMLSNGAAAALTARVSAAGGVTVTAELATTTLRHWSYSQQAVFTTGSPMEMEWQPLRPPVLVGPRCFYVQLAAATTGPSYYASADVLQYTTAQIGA